MSGRRGAILRTRSHVRGFLHLNEITNADVKPRIFVVHVRLHSRIACGAQHQRSCKTRRFGRNHSTRKTSQPFSSLESLLETCPRPAQRKTAKIYSMSCARRQSAFKLRRRPHAFLPSRPGAPARALLPRCCKRIRWTAGAPRSSCTIRGCVVGEWWCGGCIGRQGVSLSIDTKRHMRTHARPRRKTSAPLPLSPPRPLLPPPTHRSQS